MLLLLFDYYHYYHHYYYQCTRCNGISERCEKNDISLHNPDKYIHLHINNLNKGITKNGHSTSSINNGTNFSNLKYIAYDGNNTFSIIHGTTNQCIFNRLFNLYCKRLWWHLEPRQHWELWYLWNSARPHLHFTISFFRRFDGSENFYRGWDDYKNGFGNLTGEHWLGLEKLHRLTRNGHWKLRVELEDFSGQTLYAEYTDFSIGDSSTYYRLRYNEYIGAAGDSLALNKYSAFTTYDMDHDRYDRNCAQAYEGAWWYSHCTGGPSYYNKANLKGWQLHAFSP